ncbi:MAG: sulfotransferase [Acidobacteria bacterium]|nr:MAG: sulfotransferase [Acidobacteriota bacterium]
MVSWQEKLITRLGPPISLCGVVFSDWWQALRDNDFAIDSPYFFRAASMTLASLVTSLQGWFEERIFGARIAKAEIRPPVFILGHWRTGTTHLQYLLAADPRFACPNTYQVSYPHTFLITEAVGARLGGFLIPPKRPMDEVRISFQAPNEDEFALCQMTLCSPYLGFTFPRRQSYYGQFLTLRGVSEAVKARWKSAMVHFLKKLTWRYDRPLVLKSPPHTCRIKLLLDMFPNARFVHIHRNPYTVFQSTRHWLLSSGPWFHLQRPNDQSLEERILRVYREMYDVFFEERPLIPAEQFHEVSFEELEKDSIGQLRNLYEAINLPDFGQVEMTVQRYRNSLAGYKKNTFPTLDADLQKRVAREWRQCFEEWGYATTPP